MHERRGALIRAAAFGFDRGGDDQPRQTHCQFTQWPAAWPSPWHFTSQPSWLQYGGAFGALEGDANACAPPNVSAAMVPAPASSLGSRENAFFIGGIFLTRVDGARSNHIACRKMVATDFRRQGGGSVFLRHCRRCAPPCSTRLRKSSRIIRVPSRSKSTFPLMHERRGALIRAAAFRWGPAW
jgi:hypothetical protein